MNDVLEVMYKGEIYVGKLYGTGIALYRNNAFWKEVRYEDCVCLREI